MKRGSVLPILLLVIVLSAGADEQTLGFESHVIESWDGSDSGYFIDTGEPIVWRVVGTKYTNEGYPRSAYAMSEWPTELFGAFPEDPETLGVYGINGRFDRQGYNHIELIPGTGEGDDWTAKAIPLPGRVQTIDFWVWGSNQDFYTEMHFRDQLGMTHNLVPIRGEKKRALGSIKFIGWRNMFVDMPHYIKRTVNYRPGTSALNLTKIVFTSHPLETVDNFYIYVDHLKVLSNMQEEFYDGAALLHPARVEEIWGSEEE